MATYEELMQSAEQIRTNELPESNTHELVGQHLKNQVDYFNKEGNGIKSLIDTNKKEVDGKLTELNNRVDIDSIPSWAPSTEYCKNDFFKIETDAGLFIKKVLAEFTSDLTYNPTGLKTVGLDEYVKYITASQNKDIIANSLNEFGNKNVLALTKTYIGINASLKVDKSNNQLLSFYFPVKGNMTYSFIKSNVSSRDRIAYLDKPIEDYTTGDAPTKLLVNKTNDSTLKRSVTFPADGYCLYTVTATDEIVDVAVLEDIVIIDTRKSNWGIQGTGRLLEGNVYTKSVIFYAHKGQKYKLIKNVKTDRNRVALMQSDESTWYDNQMPDSIPINEEDPEDLEKELIPDFSGWVIWAYTATKEEAEITVIMPPIPRYGDDIIETRSYKQPTVWAKGKIANETALNVAEINAQEIETEATKWGIQGDGTLSGVNSYCKAFYFPVKSKTQYRLTKNKASDRDRIAFMYKSIENWEEGQKPDITIISITDSTEKEYTIFNEFDGYISWLVSATNDTEVTVQVFEGMDHEKCLYYNGAKYVPQEMPVKPYWAGWDSARYSLGYEQVDGFKTKYPIYNFIKGVLEIDGFYSVTVGDLSRWNLHLFEGWNKTRDKRFTIGIGKFSDDESFIQTFGPPALQPNGLEHWGSVRVGSDINNNGTVFSPYSVVFNNLPWIVPKKSIPSDMGDTMIKEFDNNNSLKDGTLYNDYYSGTLRTYKAATVGNGSGFANLMDSITMQAYHYLALLDSYLISKNPSDRAKYVYQDQASPGAFMLDYSITNEDTLVIEFLIKDGNLRNTISAFGWRNSGTSNDGDNLMVLAQTSENKLWIYAGKGASYIHSYKELYNNRIIVLVNARQINGVMTTQASSVMKGTYPPAIFGLNNQGQIVKAYNGLGFVKMGVFDGVNRLKRAYIPISDGQIREVVTDTTIESQDGTCLSFK